MHQVDAPGSVISGEPNLICLGNLTDSVSVGPRVGPLPRQVGHGNQAAARVPSCRMYTVIG